MNTDNSFYNLYERKINMTKEKSTTILSKSFVNQYKNKQVPWGFNGLGYIVYKRTYARPILDGSETEEWYQTVERCINGAQEIGAGYTKEEAETLYDLIFNLKCTYPGRMLWQLGTETVRRFGGNSLLNCWFTTIQKPEDFCFLFENLMLGGGVGFSVRREDIHELPRIKKNVAIDHLLTKDADFIVPDSREGWINLLRNVLNAHFETGKGFTFSTILIRGAGEKINGFGGTASGPGILIEGINKICEILASREGKKLRSIDVLDICNIIGSIVVAGNVRRSAEIALGDPDDYLFLKAKRWDTGTIPNWRSMSNNTIYADDFDHIIDEVWEGYSGNGEPYGFFNLPLAQKYGRLGEEVKDKAIGMNPCGEITLERYECCNLSELFLNNITSKEELITCAKLLYKTQKAIAALPFIHEETNKVVHQNMRLGLSVTGVCQAMHKLDWLDEAYTELKAFDKVWSATRGWKESIKLTTVKPSGTVSLLAGATPGIHPAFARHYIRRVRMSSNDPLVSFCREKGYHIEYARRYDLSEDHGTVVIEFPCVEEGVNTLYEQDMKVVDMLELVKKIQTVWSDNSVSVTAYYSPEELPVLKNWLKENYKNSIKSVSFLLRRGHGFTQAPYEAITEHEYISKISHLKNLDYIKDDGQSTLVESMECAGACPIK